MWPLLLSFAGGLAPQAVAGPKVKDPIEAAKEELEGNKKKKTERELLAEERLRALEEQQENQAARVVVLKWPGTDTDEHTESLVRNVRARIARSSARFFPDLDLYQAGRAEPDRRIRPGDQRAMVPDTAIPRVMERVEYYQPIPWDGLSEQEWGLAAHELRELSHEVWFLDRPELREPLFHLYVETGRAAENANNAAPPFYELVDDKSVNYYWYLAAVLAHEDPTLMSKVHDDDRRFGIDLLKDQIDAGGFQPMHLSFELAGEWDVKTFASEYRLLVNGNEVLIDNQQGLLNTPPGRADIYLERADSGFGLSDVVQLDRIGANVYGVRDNARKRMGIDFIDQLMEHPNECTPELDGDILTYLAIYAKLHGESDIYIAVPVGGSPNKVFLWRWDRPTVTLQRVLDDTGGFPVRFAGLFGGGLTVSGASLEIEDPEIAAERNLQNGAPSGPNAGVQTEPASVPLYYHLRGHYGRLMIATGIEAAANLPQGVWNDAFQTRNKDEFGGEQTLDVDRYRKWQRLVFTGVGLVLGREAAIGMGPRGWVRFGWFNVPHTLDLTLHLGGTAQMPFSKAKGRVRPIVDADLYGGAMFPFGQTRVDKPIANFGTTVGAGLTF